MTAHLTFIGCCILTAWWHQNNPRAERRAESDTGRRAETGFASRIKCEDSTTTLSDDEKVWTAWTRTVEQTLATLSGTSPRCTGLGRLRAEMRCRIYICCISQMYCPNKFSFGNVLKPVGWEDEAQQNCWRNILGGDQSRRKEVDLIRLQWAQRGPVKMNQIANLKF